MKKLIKILMILICFNIYLFFEIQNIEATKIIRIAGMKPELEPETIGMRNFGWHLYQISNGTIDVVVYPNSELGREEHYIANTRRGVLQMCATGTQLSLIHPPIAILEAPMVYENLAHAKKALEGKTFELIKAGLIEKTGLRMLNVFPLGFRQFYTKKPIYNIGDISLFPMRIPIIPLYKNFAKECGMNAVQVNFADIRKFFDQEIIEGGCSPLSDIIALKLYDFTPEITLTNHILSIHCFFINERFYQSLTAQEREWVETAAKKASDEIWGLVSVADENAKKIIIANGGHISEASKELHDALLEAAKRSWKLFYDTIPNAKEILDSIDSYRN